MAKYTWVIDTLFDKNKLFVKNSFIEFVEELTWKVVNDRDIKKSKSMDSSWNEYFKEELMIYEDKSWEKISIMIYKMPSSTKVEKARSYQRNLISSYLKNEWVFEGIDSVLCAFYSEDTSDWRLSFVKQEFKLNPETKKIINELTPAKRYSFLVESNSKNVTVKQRLNSLLESSNILVSDIEKTFSVEKVSKEFFDKYVKLYEKLVEAFKDDKIFLKIISESNNWDENFRENFVKKLLWQIVFLYFLQKKWWLWVEKWANWWTGKKDFLQSLLNECLNWWDEKKELWWKNFFNDYLEHLFYDNLNKKRENDYSEYFGYRIPYLNWWLFEPINNYNWKGFEYVVLSWDKNNSLFKEIFDTFDEYNFTVYENDPLEQDVAVDPEMLGKVFENLLPENERKGKWAFYTPREIVHYMCKESLKNHIINKTWITEELCEKLFTYKDSYLNATKRWNKLLDEDKYNIFETFYEYWEKIVETLKYVKIVDPAVWSGAFPMWLLKEIVSLRKFIQENVLLQENVSEYELKKETLENCIYGVDLDPGAVEIAKLRFWLSLVIEEDSKDNIDPLPNLDYKIMQWNSLIEDIVVWDSVIKIDLENNTKKLTKKEEKEFSGIAQWTMALFADEVARDDILKRLKFLHKIFFQEKDNIKKKSLKTEIDHIEKELIRISWEVEVNRIKSQIDNIEWKYIISWMAWDEKDAKKVALLYAQISSIKEMEEKYKRDNIRSFFPWKLHFWEVFNENGGFDIVIGNPPYNAELTELEKEYFKEKYPSVRTWRQDTAWIFCEFWNNILVDKWVLNYILPFRLISRKRNHWLFQEYLLLSINVEKILYLWSNVWFTANDEFMILQLINSYNEDNNIKISLKPNFPNWIIFKTIKQKIFKDYWEFNLNFLKFDLWLLDKIRINSNELDNICYVRDWIVPYIRDKMISNIQKDERYKKFNWIAWKYIIEPYFYKSKEDLYICYDINEAKKYISSDIELRKVQLRDSKIFESEKIITSQNSSVIKWTIDNSKLYVSNSIHSTFLKEEYINEYNLNYILCLLNSKLLNYYHNFFRLKWTDLHPQILLWNLKKLPIKQISQEEQKPFIDLVDQILEITKKEDYLEREDLQKQVKILESRIDDMVYKLYELTPEEIELVEESLK